MSKLSQEKDEIKALIRSILTSTQQMMTANALFYDFKNMSGFEVPYRKFGFPNFEAFLRSIPDTVMLQSSGGASPNVIPVTSEKSKHIDELVQKQKVSTKKKGPRKLRNHSATPVTFSKPNTPAPVIPDHLRKRIADLLADNPHGMEVSRLESHLWIFQLRQYGGAEKMLKQLSHIATVYNGIVYPVNSKGFKSNVPAPQSLNVMPAGYEDSNNIQECDDWEHSWSSDEELAIATKPVNGQATTTVNETVCKQTTPKNFSESIEREQQPKCFNDQANKQPSANNFSDKQSVASNFIEQVKNNPSAYNFSFTPNFSSNFSEQPIMQPSTSNFTFRPALSSNFSELGVKQPSISLTEMLHRNLSVNKLNETGFGQTSKNIAEAGYRQQSTNTFVEPVFKQPITHNLNGPGYTQPLVNSSSQQDKKRADKQADMKYFKDPGADMYTAISIGASVILDKAWSNSDPLPITSGKGVSSEAKKANEKQDQNLNEKWSSWSPMPLTSAKNPELTSANKKKKKQKQKKAPDLDAGEFRKLFYMEEEKRVKESCEWKKDEHERKMEIRDLKIKLNKQQLNYLNLMYMEEEKRAKERHEWQREEHEQKMKLLDVKIKLNKEQLNDVIFK